MVSPARACCASVHTTIPHVCVHFLDAGARIRLVCIAAATRAARGGGGGRGGCKYQPKLSKPSQTSGAQAAATDARDNTYGRGAMRRGVAGQAAPMTNVAARDWWRIQRHRTVTRRRQHKTHDLPVGAENH